ncbi:MAG TPA: hypothetical protein VLC46_20275 [Thermoanaerobaculia bacterium]|jgi:hypothetical protein|nr:hypothetical protein [Thermoanaerobaculia bacterium]
MPTPSLQATDSFFQEAIAYHRARVPISDSALAQLSNEARMRAFWVTGMARQAEAVATHRLIDESLRNGTTDAQFRADYAKLTAANGGSLLSIDRQNLVLRQATGLAYSSGRIEKMLAVAGSRPIWMYPLGPHDDRTTEICLQLEGFMAPADWPGWQHIAPPNHFRERHLALLSITLEEAQAFADKGGKVLWKNEDGDYAVIDGQQMLPASGFDMPASLLASDENSLLEEFGKLAEEFPAGDAESYDLSSIAELAADDVVAAPEIEAAGDAEAGWTALREAAGVPDNLEETIVPDLFGDGAIINRGSYDAIFGDKDPELAPLLPELLTDPAEVWFVPFDTPDGVTIVKRFMGAFDVAGETVWIWADQSPDGWIAEGGVGTPDQMDALRKGYLVMSKAPRKAKAALDASETPILAGAGFPRHGDAKPEYAPQSGV